MTGNHIEIMKHFYWIIIAFHLISCTQQPVTKNLKVIDLAGNIGKGRVVKLSEIAESIEYIPLETNNKSILGVPQSISCFENGYLYIKQSSGGFKIFNQSGKFIRLFNRSGRGPQEYNYVGNFNFETSTNNILISTYREMIEYDQDGRFVRKYNWLENEDIKRLRPYSSFVINKNLYLLKLSKNTHGYLYCVTDSLLDIKYFIKQSQKELDLMKKHNVMRSVFSPYHYKFRDSIRIFNGYDENILSISNHSKPDTCFILNYGKYDFKDSDTFNSGYLKSKPYIRRYDQIFESSNHIFMTFNLGSLAHKPQIMLRRNMLGNKGETITLPVTHSFFNKNTGEFSYIDQPEFNQKGMVDDFEGGPAFWPSYISEDDYMVDIIDAHQFIEHAKSNQVSEKFKNIADNLKETDNPILVLVKLN
jgi:hypothetical protein